MVWLFERDEELLKLETRYDNDTREYVVIVHYPDGREETERFTEQEPYRQRLVVLEHHLDTERWRHDGLPIIVADGWPNKRPT